MRTGFRYTVKYVEVKNTSNGVLTKFSCGEKMKGSENYANWHCVAFDDLGISDNDRIMIDSIESIDSREYNGKIYTDIVVKAHKVESERQDVTSANPFD